MSGTKDRKDRIINPKSGVSGSSSQDLVKINYVLIVQSKEYAEKYDGNISIYAIAGIPIMFSALRALLLEANSGVFGISKKDRLEDLADGMSEVKFIGKHYLVDATTMEDLNLAYEVRNEIAHPSHLPAGTNSGTPAYLSTLSDRGLLQNGIWLSQLQSHKLYIWVCEIFAKIVPLIIEAHHSNPSFKAMHLESWKRYEDAKL